MSAPRNLRNALKSLVPNWLSDRARGLNVGFAVLFAFALFCDLIIEAMYEGVFAAWPGKGTPTALALNGQSRGLIRGLAETDDAYAERLRGWLDVWPEAGSDETLVRLIQTYLGNNLVVRIVDRAGRFTTIHADGSVTTATDATWNFDSLELPERASWNGDLWIIIYVTDGRWVTYSTLGDPAWTARWGVVGSGIGLSSPTAAVKDIAQIIAVFKGAHTWVEAIVLTDDAAAFVPGSLGVTYPNGRWGHWSRDIAGTQTRSRANTTAGGYVRYWVPQYGG